MIKQLMVGLDGSKSTEAVTRFGCDLAKIHDARLIGVSVADVACIEQAHHTPRPLGAGSADMEYYNKSVQDARDKADAAIELFNKVCEKYGIEHKTMKKEGCAAEEILNLSSLNDIVILPRKSCFSTGLSDDEFHDATPDVLEKTSRPLLLVPDAYREVKKVMIAVDLQRLSNRLLFSYVHLNPYPDARTFLVHVSESKDADIPAELVEYFKVHGIEIEPVVLHAEHTGQALVTFAESEKMDVAVIGIHTMSKVWSALLGSTGRHVLDKLAIPVFTIT